MFNEKWDRRFLQEARAKASWSKDPSTKCGAVIVKPEPNGTKRIVATGYNGFPAGCSDNEEVYAERELKYARVIHAEMNALIQAQESLHGCAVYTWPIPPCDRCAAHLIQAGIKSVVALVPPSAADSQERWGDSLARAEEMYEEANVAWKVIYSGSSEE